MIPRKNLKALNLTAEQKETYKKLEERERILYRALTRNGVHKSAIREIINNADLLALDTNETVLDAEIKENYRDLIILRGGTNEN